MHLLISILIGWLFCRLVDLGWHFRKWLLAAIAAFVGICALNAAPQAHVQADQGAPCNPYLQYVDPSQPACPGEDRQAQAEGSSDPYQQSLQALSGEKLTPLN